MIPRPKISVIVPNYNHSNYLKQRVESILSQTYTNFELILLDDCSIDNSREIIISYKNVDTRIKIVFNKVNSGSVFKQWSKGLTLAQGEYVWIAESDDSADPRFLNHLVSILDQNDKLSFAYSDSWVIDESGATLSTTSDWKNKHFNTQRWNHDHTADGRQELNQFLSLQCTVNNASSVLFRRSSIASIDGIDTTFRYAGDWMTYIKLSIQGDIAYSAERLSNYRVHASNASKKSEDSGDQLFERQKCFAYIYETGALSAEARKVMLTQASREYLDLLYRLVKKNKRALQLVFIAKELSKISLKYFIVLQYNITKLKLFKI